MHTRVAIILAIAGAIGLAACKKDKDKDKPTTTTPTGSGSPTMAGSGDKAGTPDMAGSGDKAGTGNMAGSGDKAGTPDMAGSAAPTEPEMAKKAGNCPSMVFGAITKAEVKGKDVIVTITSEDKDAQLSVQK